MRSSSQLRLYWHKDRTIWVKLSSIFILVQVQHQWVCLSLQMLRHLLMSLLRTTVNSIFVVGNIAHLVSGKRKALLVGINYIGTSRELKGCIEDTKHMRKLLTAVYGFPDNDSTITVLTDDNPNTYLQPTKKNILTVGILFCIRINFFFLRHFNGSYKTQSLALSSSFISPVMEGRNGIST